MKKIRTNKLLLFILVLALVPSCAINPVTGKKQFMLMSEAQEIALGAQYDPSVVSTFGVYDQPQLLDFITSKGAEMGKISHRPNLEYHFKILDSPVINAFAVPGGYIYLTRGILAQFNNEAELIGVLGHEMGHITARHTASQQSKQQLGQLLLVGGMIASEEFRQFADYAMQGMQLLFLKFSRDNEREADRLGVEYSSKIHYDAHQMANFFNMLNKMQMASNHAGVPTFMSTHPDPGDRYNAVNIKAKEWQDSLNYSNWEVNENSYLQMIDGLVYGEDPRQGFVEANMFYHPEMKFKYPIPPGWKLVNSPMQVQMTPEDGKAMMVFFMTPQKTLEKAGQEALDALGLTVLDSKRTIVNGAPAIVAVSQQVSQDQQTGQQQTIKVLSYIIQKDEGIYVFHGVSDEMSFNSYFRIFESTMANFDSLTEPSKLNVRPKRIKVKSVQRSGTLADAFKYFRVPQSQTNELALLNYMELSDIVQKGKLIKIIGD
ncbi:MAG: M48 family metalloprotease [Draconibacterium sp.]|nr:M48 family metalloprotease [Draconibacterium sp.]